VLIYAHIHTSTQPLLWRIYIFYSYNAAALRESQDALTRTKFKHIPVFHAATRIDKRLLHQDDFWQLLNDFGLVPSVIK
jgi:hypothetical protein